MLIGICFWDNDFNQTVKAFLRLFVNSYLVELYPQNLTKERICQIWYESFYGIYLVVQKWVL